MYIHKYCKICLSETSVLNGQVFGLDRLNLLRFQIGSTKFCGLFPQDSSLYIPDKCHKLLEAFNRNYPYEIK